MRESVVTTWHYKTPTIQEFNISKQYLFCNYIKISMMKNGQSL